MWEEPAEEAVMSNMLLLVLGILGIIHIETALAVTAAIALVLMLLGCVYVAEALQGAHP
ncbi:hypothetical protein [Kineosporia babensis]|uniref:Uncharacterized protein n=1 Tax=Kineosporia babensis TaxID=499548 RepID=A0A9X1NPK4_9ACTN|nr:hypothetical protein [Kineosporia babensis]MCD5316863.1 hypothetical protein [Kineosporia babensis]